MNNIELIKGYTSNNTWKIACPCKKCMTLAWYEVPVTHLAWVLDLNNIRIDDTKAFGKFCHDMVQATN